VYYEWDPGSGDERPGFERKVSSRAKIKVVIRPEYLKIGYR